MDGTIICYDLLRADPRRAVLIVPGFWRTRRWPTMLALADRAVAAGLTAVTMDLRGHGDSGGRFTFGCREWEDVIAVAEDLRAMGWRAIDVIGFSLGGAAATVALARRTDLPWRSLLLVSSVADLTRVRPRLNPFTAHRHLAVSQAFRKPRIDWRSFRAPKPRPVDEIEHVSVPVTVVHVANDWLVNHAHGQALHDRCRGERKLVLLDIPGHWHADRIFAAAPERIDAVLADFFAAGK